MNSRKVQIALAVVFFVVGVLAGWNTWQLNEYVRQTLPRDDTQEQCIRTAVDTINLWVAEQAQSYEIHHDRDVIIDELISNPAPATPEQLARLDAAIQKADASRLQYLQLVKTHPLKACLR